MIIACILIHIVEIALIIFVISNQNEILRGIRLIRNRINKYRGIL